MTHQNITLGDAVYLYFALNTPAGDQDDGSSLSYYVRQAGDAANAAPFATSSPTLLSHASYPEGSYEIAINTTVGGYAANTTYAVFCEATVSSTNPNGFVGSFHIGPVPAELADVTTHGGSSAEITLAKLTVSGNDADGVIDIDNAGGPAINAQGSTYGVVIGGDTGVSVTSTVSQGVVITGASIGLACVGLGSSGLYVDGTTSGALIQGNSGTGLRLTGSSGPGVDIDGTTFGVDIDCSSGPGVAIDGDTGIAIASSNAQGVTITGNTIGLACVGLAGAGLYVDGSTSDILGNITGSIDTVNNGVTLASSEDVFFARISAIIDASNSQDEYSVTFYHNDEPIDSGDIGSSSSSGEAGTFVNNVYIRVIKRSDGTDLIASSLMDEVGDSGSFKYDEATNRLTEGEAAIVEISADINGSPMTWREWVGRDSEA